MKLNPKYVLLISDALIPILGFFLWDWSLYFILLFYFFDLVAQEGIMHFKSRAIISAQGNSATNDWMKLGIVSVMILTLVIVLIHLAVLFIHPSIDFKEQALSFWKYKELGIQQGFLLFPLVAFAAYQQYRMSFLLRGRARTDKIPDIWKTHLKALLVVIGFTGLVLGLTQFIVFSDTVYVLSIVAIIAIYNLLFAD